MRHSLYLLVLLFSTVSAVAQNGVITTYQLPSILNEPECLVATSDRVYFLYDDGPHGYELWYIDETTNKAKIAIDHMPGIAQGVAYNTPLAGMPKSTTGAIGEYVYFLAFDDSNFQSRQPILSRYSATTNKVDYLARSTLLSEFKPYKNKLYIYGIVYGRLGIFEHDPNAITMDSLIINDKIRDFDLADGKLYYSKYTGGNPAKIYEYDLSTRTKKIAISSDTANGGQFDQIIGWHCFNDELYFVGVAKNDTSAFIYKYNSVNGATLLKDKNTGRSYNTIFELIYNDGRIYFENTVNGGANNNLKYYDLNTETYTTVNNFLGNKYPKNQYQYLNFGEHCNYNDKLFMATNYYSQIGGGVLDRELGVYNPKTGSSDIINIYKGSVSSDPVQLNPLNGALYFMGYYGINVQNTRKIIRYYEAPTAIPATKHSAINSVIYPNPTTANTTLELQLDKIQSLSVKLTDITGRTVHTIPSAEYTTGKHNITLPMKLLPNGTYLYSIRDNNGMLLTSGKIVKE